MYLVTALIKMQEFVYMETLLQITVIPQRWKNISFEEYLITLL